ncbi:MAG: TonB-dependent receptor [Sterolibacterium sp.]|nr:TonB-dependent receptor [Sterolibacterium sp.]MBP9799712.1 TonB-dependent receptor [Sterolibacterium sp.]
MMTPPRCSRHPAHRRHALLAVIVLSGCTSPSLWAQAGTNSSNSADSRVLPVFSLGTVVVTAAAPKFGGIPEDQVASVVTREEMQQYNRDTLADALNLLSGVTISHGQKNERRVSIRGFEPSKVGLFIDGIPVYIPFDGAVDMNRFTTADLAAIQVAKGFTSVAYGPNTMAGVINLVTRKPRRTLEGDARIGFGTGNERLAQVNVGSNQGQWYVQGGLSYTQSDNFRLSSEFTPTRFEDGGARNNSYRKDQKLSFKLGLTPNASDEYALSVISQHGAKGQPTNTLANAQFWRWPYWDKDSLYLSTRTALGSQETLRVKLYHDTFNNAIDMYKDAAFTTLSGGKGTGESIYHDKTDGGSIELESTRFRNQTLRLFAFYKKDRHDKNDYSGVPAKFDRMQDTLLSYALEDNLQIRHDLLLSLGVSHHTLKPGSIDKSDVKPALTLPEKKSANDAQAGLYYDLSATARLYTTASKKTQLPSMASRYNSAFGAYVENPALQPEKSANYEIGYQGTPWKGIKVEAAYFYSNVKDKIQTWYPNPNLPCTANTNVCQTRNLGEVRYSGIELGANSLLTAQLELGGNATWTDPKVISNPNNRSGAKVTDVPKQKITLHATYRPLASMELVAFVENNSKRWVSDTVELGAYTTLNLKAAYQPLKDLTLEVGVNNANDRNYSLANGFPQPGRMWFANGSYKF